MGKDTVIEIGREPVKIQVLTGIDGVTFDQSYAGKVLFEDAGLKIPFIGLEDLLKDKAALPRGKDKIYWRNSLKRSGRKGPLARSPLREKRARMAPTADRCA
ncbi:MAG: hypothetical protein EXS43_09560 [Opitutus sp.]|nr:hypothetical protein [Opitutus sp.]